MSDIQLLRGSMVRPDQRPRSSRRQGRRHVFINDPQSERQRSYTLRTKIFIGILIIMVITSALLGYFIGKSVYERNKTEPPDPVTPPTPSASKLRVFQRSAVCTDAPQCSEIGKQTLARNGSAVDAAIAAMFCDGLLNQQSMGIGGGFFMVVYIKQEGRAYSVNAREKAPQAATRGMFQGSYEKSTKGGLSVGVPGEVRGMWEIHKKWGRLPWDSLIAPSLELCRTGYTLSEALYRGLHLADPYIKNDINLGKVYYDSKNSQYYQPGTRIKLPPVFCDTLQRIAEKGGDDFYNGSLAADILDDLQRAGSIITADDLRNYQPKILDPIAVSLQDGNTLYTSPPPSSGVILVQILNVLSGYNFTSDNVQSTNSTVLTYHRILEAFKYAFAVRTKLGDEDYLDLKELISKVTSNKYAMEIRQKINDTMTSNNTETYGAEEYVKPDSGTAHFSIVAENGDAVSVTSSINFYFGAGFTTKRTGIVMNNVMGDFSSPGITNYFGLKPSPANFIEPGKRPLSSTAPSIMVDNKGDVRLVIGGAGGTKTTTAVALVMMRKLWFGQSLKEAVDAPRFHHQIFPMNVDYQYGMTEDIVQGLRRKGHGMVRYTGYRSVVCALYRNETAIYGNADYRKAGDVTGID